MPLSLARLSPLFAAAVLAACTIASAAPQVGTVFVIAMENHNLAQPSTYTSIQQLQGNTAAPFLNSLMTPGNPNAAQTAYASNYTNAGTGVHPSEPNYLWAEAGTNYNKDTNTTITGDNDPSASSKNIFATTPHLTSQLNAAGISWNNYQEDYQYSSGPTVSASGTGGTHNGNLVVANPYYGTTQYNYAVKHNPMAFFTDTATQNDKTFSQLSSDLAADNVALSSPTSNFGRYNWITPNQYNDMHSSLSTNFTYNGTSYTHGTDQQAIAIGDNFLATIVPQIQATQAYQNNGAIVIWFDESEGGDTTATTIPEIVISPLAKGNAYNSAVPLNHSSDIATWEELLGLPNLTNTIPANEISASGIGYNNVATVNDLSSLFQTHAVPEPASLSILILGTAALMSRRRK